jgi:hypothetical protein
MFGAVETCPECHQEATLVKPDEAWERDQLARQRAEKEQAKCEARLETMRREQRQNRPREHAKMEAKRQAELKKAQRAERESRAFRDRYYPSWACPRCGETLWQLKSVSPTGVSATWVCKYCERTEIVRADMAATNSAGREPIPRDVQNVVWQRDQGKCVRCGSNEKLEYDHIIPVCKRGSNTARNIQLLCESCNRSKGGNWG